MEFLNKIGDWFKNTFRNAGFNDIGARLQGLLSGDGALMAGGGAAVGYALFGVEGAIAGGLLGAALKAFGGVQVLGEAKNPSPNTGSNADTAAALKEKQNAMALAGGSLMPVAFSHNLPQNAKKIQSNTNTVGQ